MVSKQPIRSSPLLVDKVRLKFIRYCDIFLAIRFRFSGFGGAELATDDGHLAESRDNR